MLSSSQPRPWWKTAGVCILLVVTVFAVFGQTAGFGFLTFDDDQYVTQDPAVLNGLSFADIEWAFTHQVSQHWHPLTLIVLMIEHGFFGLWPGGYHLVNAAFHAVGVVLLFLMLVEMTGAFWRSAFVAAVFAIHPLRAESVAWISECKDVLSGIFFMLTLWAYARYARHKSKRSYFLMLLCFALGLMSKPMLVTVPCLLLLLDYWPLGRLRTPVQLPALLREKLPLFALSALSSIAAIVALKAGNPHAATYPANAPIAYIFYLEKMFHPVGLAAFYPVPREGWPAWEIFDDLLILAALTAVVWIFRRRYPWLPVGWFWYLGMLVPVAGVLQTQNDAYADRYTYLPQIGICIALAWLAADWAGAITWRRALLGGACAAILCALLATARRQVAYWRDNETLWRHTLAVTEDNPVAHLNLGIALLAEGRIDEGIAECRAALRLTSKFAKAHENLGYGLYQQGRITEAIAEYHAALHEYPDDAEAHYDLATALARLGRDPEAVPEYREALRYEPDLEVAHKNLGNTLVRLGRAGEALGEYREALRLDPSDPAVENAMAWILATVSDKGMRNGAEAVKLATKANQSTGGKDPGILRTLAAAYAQTGDYSNAQQTAQRALDLAAGGSDPALAGALRGDLKLYQSGHGL